MTNIPGFIKAIPKATFVGLFFVAGVLAGAGCSHAPQVEAAPPPRAEAHPLADVQGKHPRPRLPRLAGDTRPQAPGQ